MITRKLIIVDGQAELEIEEHSHVIYKDTPKDRCITLIVDRSGGDHSQDILLNPEEARRVATFLIESAYNIERKLGFHANE